MFAAEKFQAAMAAGDLGAAEAVLREALAQSPDEAVVIQLAKLLRKMGRAGEAETLLAAAAPTYQVLDQLARVQYERHAFAACEVTLERLIALAPEQTPLVTYQLLAKVKAARGAHDDARNVILRGVAAHPGATEFVAAYAAMLSPTDAVRELEAHLQAIGRDPARLAYILSAISNYRAAHLRAERGLPRHGVSWADTYQWPDQDALPELKTALVNEIARGSKRASALTDLACVAIGEGDWEGAEAQLLKLREGPKRTQADFSAFGTAFHARLDSMSDGDLLNDLCPVERLVTPAFQSDVSVFIGSDPNYFTRFTLPFLRTLEAAEITLDVHVHILDGPTDAFAEIQRTVAAMTSVRVTLTAEASGAALKGTGYARNYYHAIRFVRLYEEITRAQRPMWMIDADAHLLRDPRALLSSLKEYDVALRTSPCEFSPNLKITATCVGIAPTAHGLEFARRVAAYIIHWKNEGTWAWGVDQMALLSSYAHMSAEGRAPVTLFLDDQAINDKTGDTGVLKFLSGIDKYSAPVS